MHNVGSKYSPKELRVNNSKAYRGRLSNLAQDRRSRGKAWLGMGQLTAEQQHNSRNALQCLHGFILRPFLEKRITEPDMKLAYEWLEKIDKVLNATEH